MLLVFGNFSLECLKEFFVLIKRDSSFLRSAFLMILFLGLILRISVAAVRIHLYELTMGRGEFLLLKSILCTFFNN